ncbi:AraC family transcriptional regulator [Diplocloster modestus]|uniref:AraC family transcriptional regulator n=1 Tax=Diplocloster modestus TaxID=2850322 RepID=A0ABS6KDP7_9FIRM|nr:AraC family transcriptional regulator [Diplocloster modestus]MBU9728645.1 AraC family transcriptional regulator [Diplocloster modestus]
MPLNFSLDFADIQPNIRYVQRFRVTKEEYPDFFRPYDCRFFLVSKGSGCLYTIDASYRLSRGDVFMYHSGTEYRMVSDDGNLLILLGVNFDYTQSNKNLVVPIPPEPIRIFDENRILERVFLTDMPAMNQFIYLQNMQSLESTLQDMLIEFDSKKIFYSQRLSGLFLSILSQCYRTLSLGQNQRSFSAKKAEQILSYIQQHYTENITNVTIGQHFNYHPNYLNKQFIKYTGKSLHQYLMAYRISKAIEMITSTDMTISEIADTTGFSDIHHFSKTFRQKTGMSPRGLRSSKQNLVLDI